MRRGDDRSSQTVTRERQPRRSLVAAVPATLALIAALLSSISCSRRDEGGSGDSGAGDAASRRGSSDEPMMDGELDEGEALALGKATYEVANCRQCHGASGQGGPLGPDLTDDSWAHFNASSPTAAQIQELLLSGIAKHEMRNTSYPIAMPSVSPTVSDPEAIDALAMYVLSLEK